MAQQPVTKVYRLETLGFDVVHKDLQALAKDFQAIKKAKKEAETGLASAKTSSDASKYREELQKIKIAEAEVRLQRQQMISEQKAATIARQNELNQQKQAISQNKGEANSINERRVAISELNKAIVNRSIGAPIAFRNELLTYDQAIAKLKELKTAEQDFQRQFQKDGTLVAEYSTGIVSAFKKMGLDDLIGGQVTKSQARLNELNLSFDRLQKELAETKAAGQSTETIERQMIENRNEVIKLDTELARLRRDLRGVGDVGNQITTSISNGFKNLKSQVGQFVLGFIGVQAAISGIQKSFTDTLSLDSLDSSLRAVSGTTAEFAVNQKFLADITERLGLVVLDTSVAYKNFFAASTQAGISADQTREIFSAAASASANLKLSQEQVNGVLLAFGQIASKGKVQAEELRGQIGERIPGAFSIAARAIGVTQQQLNKMLEDGTVLSTEFLPKFAAELQKTFGVSASKRVEGLQANVNRLKNEFTDLLESNRAGLTSFFSLLIEASGILIKLLPVLIVSVALYSAEMLRAYIATQLTTQGTILFRLALIGQQAATIIANIALTAYYGTIALLTGGLTRATIATRLFSLAFKAFPLGVILTIVGLLAGAFVLLARSVSGSAKVLGEHALKQLALRDATRVASEEIAKETGELNKWYKTAVSANSSLTSRQEAIQKLINQFPEHFGNLKKDTAANEDLAKAYDKATAAIRRKAFANAAAKLAAEAQEKVDEVAEVELILDTEFANTKGLMREITGLTRAQRNLILQAAGDDLRITRTGQGIQFDEREFSKLKERLAIIGEERALVTKTFDDLEEKITKPGPVTEGPTLFQRFDALVKSGGTDAEFDKLLNEVKTQREKTNRLSSEYKSLLALEQKINDLLNPKDKKNRLPRASRLTGLQKDALKDIEADRDEELARLKNALITRTQFQRKEQDILKIGEDGKLKIVRESRAITIRGEEDYLLESFTINVRAINEKLKLLTGANAEERKQIAELKLEKISIEQETNNKILEIRSKALKDLFDTEIANAKEAADKVIQDPKATELEKLQAKLDADKKMLDAQIRFNAAMDLLEQDRNFVSGKNAEDRERELRRIQQSIQQNENEILQGQLGEIRTAGEKQIIEFNINYIKLRQAILANDKLTATQRKKALENLARLQNFTILSGELAQLTLEFQNIEKQYKKGLKTEKEFLDARLKMEQKAEEQRQAQKDLGKNKLSIPSNQNVQDLLTDQLAKSFGFEDDSEESRVLGDIIAQSYNLAFEAMNSFFDAERQQIEDNLEIQLQRIEIEKDQAVAKAQSQAEIESLEKQAASKKLAAEREAQQKLKQSRRAEAKLAFAVELANIAVQASQYPFPASLIIGGILAALAFGRYALRVSEINSAKFAKGGIVKEKGKVPVKTGGKVSGPSHRKGGVKFIYEAEGEELAIINKRSAKDTKVRTITGTNKQIASMINELGGGIKFAGGAKVKKFESGGFIGQSLQAPVFTPASTTIVNHNGDKIVVEKFDELIDRIDTLADEQSRRIDRLEVRQVTSTVTDAQKKQVKQSSIGTL